MRSLSMLSVFTLLACGGSSPEPAPQQDDRQDAERTATTAPAGPVPTLLAVQAHFERVPGGGPKALPAKLVMFRYSDGTFFRDELLDEDSNVFHKVMPWRGGLITIGAMKAKIKHWTREGAGQDWEASVIWERSWGGRFDRMRDLELGDVTGDGAENFVVATHDQGVIAVGTEVDGAWTFDELERTPDTFIHEIEIGDVDGDGQLEFYATPSERNRAAGTSQPGGVIQYRYIDGSWQRAEVVMFEDTHAKEILVADLDGDGTSELYVAREAIKVEEAGKPVRKDPVRILRYDPQPDGSWTPVEVATLQDDQCRFLVAGDVNHDGRTDLVAAGYKSGLWLIERQDDGTFKPTLIDAGSSGFEHAIHLADLDRDGKLEIYAAADDQKAFRRYVWNGERFDRSQVDLIGPANRSHITWNLADAEL